MNFHHTRGLPMPERFWAKVDRRGVDECWPWLAAIRRPDEGYGAFRLDGRQDCAHRVALSLSGIAVPNDRLVLHRCDNPPCCNPAHLFLGDQLANMADKVAKGRQARGATHPRAKVSEADVARLRALCPAPGGRIEYGLRKRLSAELGLSTAQVWRLMRFGWSAQP